jgi:hypothetical protein
MVSELQKAINIKFEEYLLALGKVAHSWNLLHEALAQIFATLSNSDDRVAFAIWYSTNSDRAQREMLRSTLEIRKPELKQPNAYDDLKWLLDKSDGLSMDRNIAIHAPCSIAIAGHKLEMMSSFFNGHPLAAKLVGKNILAHFAWYEARSDTLLIFARKIYPSLSSGGHSWPERPVLPTLKE